MIIMELHCISQITIVDGNIIHALGLGNIWILSFIVILKCHNNRYQRDFFSIIKLPAQNYC